MGKTAGAALLLAALLVLAVTEARYLPTRGEADRLDRLRDLIKDLLEGDLDKVGNPAGAVRSEGLPLPAPVPERMLLYKRQVPIPMRAMSMAEDIQK